MEKADLLIKNTKVYNSYLKCFMPADVYVQDGRIYYVDTRQENALSPDEVLDGSGCLMLPGFIDIHMHIESLFPWGNGQPPAGLPRWCPSLTRLPMSWVCRESMR